MDRIGIFIHEYGLGNSPTLMNSGYVLAEMGFVIDYFISKTFVGDQVFSHPRITIHQIDEKHDESDSSIGSCVKKFIPTPVRNLLGNMYTRSTVLKKNILDKLLCEKRTVEYETLYLKDMERYVHKAVEIIGVRNYKLFFGVETGGLIAAARIGKERGIPVIYYNLELRLSSEIQTIREGVIKKYEKVSNASAACTITLDEERALLLAEENGIDLKDILCVPVCADGPRFTDKTDILRKRFNLSRNDKIILYAGFLCEWAMTEELARAAFSWPENRVLVLHSHGYHDPGFIKKIKKYEGDKVKISLDPVSYKELPAFLSSADIGIALYKNLGKNLTLIRSASGKLAHYLKSGLPVITNNYPGMKSLIDAYQCGECVNSPGDINAAMEAIFKNYEAMRRNTFMCYEENYMFSKQFEKVVEKIKTFLTV
ncbi:MAG: hypothetical protein MRJ65_12130 [Candidatus Brocadiaceae bacterium]|nr:hypothetical protein [Candidatus Brocadiaceae bacterium]